MNSVVSFGPVHGPNDGAGTGLGALVTGALVGGTLVDGALVGAGDVPVNDPIGTGVPWFPPVRP
jgi:hypothetical protein